MIADNVAHFGDIDAIYSFLRGGVDSDGDAGGGVACNAPTLVAMATSVATVTLSLTMVTVSFFAKYSQY